MSDYGKKKNSERVEKIDRMEMDEDGNQETEGKGREGKKKKGGGVVENILGSKIEWMAADNPEKASSVQVLLQHGFLKGLDAEKRMSELFRSRHNHNRRNRSDRWSPTKERQSKEETTEKDVRCRFYCRRRRVKREVGTRGGRERK